MSPHSWLVGHRSTLPHEMQSQVCMLFVESVITLSTLVPIVWSQVSGRKTSTITIIHVLAALACLVPAMRRTMIYTSILLHLVYSFARCLDIHVSVIRGIRYEAHETCRICTSRSDTPSGGTRTNIKTSQACRRCLNGQSSSAILTIRFGRHGHRSRRPI